MIEKLDQMSIYYEQPLNESDWEKLANKITVITMNLEAQIRALNKKSDSMLAILEKYECRENYH
jgi:hypothetical protein